MSVSRRGRRMLVRLATGLGVLAAFPFLASGVAQAAMAGANPLTTTTRPDLRTLHVNSVTDQATWCFDKTLSNQGFGGAPIAPGNFFLGGYRFDTAVTAATANLSSSNTQCIVGTIAPKFNYGGNRDLTSYTFGTVARQAVIANAGGSGAPGNIADSTANLDSVSNSGTTDHTTGPDLQSVLPPDTTDNEITFVFDQNVRHGVSPSGQNSLSEAIGQLYFYDTNGNPHFGFPIGADNSGDVVVAFCTGFGQPAPLIPAGFQCNQGADSVSSAVRAVATRTNFQATNGGTSGSEEAFCAAAPKGCAEEGQAANEHPALQEQAGDPQTGNPTESVVVPGTSGITARPDLTSAAIVQASGNATNQVDFTFDNPISSGNAAGCTVTLSNGQEIEGSSESVIAPNTIRVTFSAANLQNFQELAVKASAYGFDGLPDLNGSADACAMGVNTILGAHPTSSVGGVPIGDNAGANSAGFTDGPDFESVTFNNSNGTVVLQADQRINPATVSTTASNWTLLATDGTVITSTPQSAAVVNNAPYQSQVVLTFLTNEIQRATAIQVSGPPVCGNDGTNFALPASFTFGGGGFAPAGNVCQVLAPTASGVAFHDPAKGRVHVRYQRARHLAVLKRFRHNYRHHNK